MFKRCIRRARVRRAMVGLWLLSHTKPFFEAHIQQGHGADFEVCPRCPQWVRFLDRVGQWFVG